MISLSKEQRKIIYFAVAAAVFLFLFWQFVYSPQIRRLALIKNQLKDADSQILEIKGILQGKDVGEVLKDMEVRLKKIENQLFNKEETVINNLSETAKNLNIEIKNLSSLSRRAIEIPVSGYDIEELPVTLNLAGEFMAINRYLDILRNSPAFLVKVRELKIQGAGEGRVYLEAVLQISVYLFKKIL